MQSQHVLVSPYYPLLSQPIPPPQLLSCPHNDDYHLPISHTCFFQLELPKYSSKAVMRTKLVYAIHNCRAIDADYDAQNVNWNDE